MGLASGPAFLPGAYQMLINCGLLGLLIAVAFFAWPISKLRNRKSDVGILAVLAILSFVYAFISSAIYMPIAWMMLGIAYARVNQADDHDLIQEEVS